MSAKVVNLAEYRAARTVEKVLGLDRRQTLDAQRAHFLVCDHEPSCSQRVEDAWNRYAKDHR